jgi:hypothetical protein
MGFGRPKKIKQVEDRPCARIHPSVSQETKPARAPETKVNGRGLIGKGRRKGKKLG